MFETISLHDALASVGAASVTVIPTVVAPVSNHSLITPLVADCRSAKPRKPKSGCEYSPSIYRPLVLAQDRLHCWTTPYTLSHHNSVLSSLPRPAAEKLFGVMLSSLDTKTRSNYGAGLLRFTQFCDTLGLSEGERFPACQIHLAAFVAD